MVTALLPRKLLGSVIGFSLLLSTPSFSADVARTLKTKLAVNLIGYIAGHCNSVFTVDDLWNIIGELVDHGDLTDIAFLEKAAKTPLYLGPASTSPDGKTITRVGYFSNSILGTSVRLDVNIYSATSRDQTFNKVGDVRFDSWSENGFSECLRLKRSDILQHFKGSWITPPPSNGNKMTSSANFLLFGRNGSKFSIAFLYDIGNGYVQNLVLTQQE